MPALDLSSVGVSSLLMDPSRTLYATPQQPHDIRTMAAPETCSCSGTVRASRWCRPCASSPRAHSSHWSRGSQAVTHSGLRAY